MSKNDDELLENLLDEWEDAEEQGTPIAPEQLCHDHPHLLARFQEKLDRLKRAEKLLHSSRAITPPPLSDANSSHVHTSISYSCSALLGQGGLGKVFQAKDHQLNRNVAIKFLQTRHVRSERSFRQFEVEAELTSRLDHPGIIPIYSHGITQNGEPFYVMRHMEGQSLREQIAEFHATVDHRLQSQQQVEFHKILGQFAWICRVIHYAHSRGVIHRDIKPDNVMVGKHGETVVLDWGLAASVGRGEHYRDSAEHTLQLSDERNSEPIAQAGTPAYMSPEQFSGADFGPHSDIYALGATLYFLLTGRSPYNSKQALPILREKITQGKLANPNSINSWIPSALNAICMKAMDVSPENRYQTAEELALEIERFLADEPVLAYKEPTVNRAVRWMRNHKFLTQLAGFAIATIVISLAGISMIASSTANQERDARIAANEARKQALKLAAGYAARTVGIRMNARWIILESTARQQPLIDLLSAIESDHTTADWESIQSQLRRVAEEYHDDAGDPASWFICDLNGRQVARVKPSPKSMGKNYRHRDYFHGNGRDLPEGSKADPPHISMAHRSKVYVSSSSGKLKVALTTPIWSESHVTPETKFLGIIGMSVELGEFAELQSNLESGQIAMVIDLAENIIDKQTLNGLVLHHPKLEASSGQQEKKTLNPQLLAQVDSARDELRNAIYSGDSGDLTKKSTLLLNSFTDPFHTNQANMIAYAAPVFVVGRPIENGDTNWAVVIAEEMDED